MNEQEINIILTSAMQSYMFNKIFEDHNGGKPFDLERWIKDVKELTSDSLFSISAEKQERLVKMLENLDDYAGIEDIKPESESNQLKLI